MLLDWDKIEDRLAEIGWRKKDLAAALGVKPPRITTMRIRAQAGEDFNPATAGNLARALGLNVREIRANGRDAA